MHPPTSALYHRLGYAHLAAWMQANGLEQWAQALPGQIARGINAHRYGDLPKWLAALQALPNLRAETIDLATGVTLAAQNVTPQDRRQLETALKTLSPWRKGPYDLFGVKIDAEWRSDWKWQRLLPHIAPLKDRLILDVGCGNGYHLWRALGSGAHRAIGIDPSPRYGLQFAALRQLTGGDPPAHLIPTPLESLPPRLQAFDSVFSMGVLYHRKSPLDHLQALRDTLKPGGQLILETLIIPGDQTTCLVPPARYAKMPNVWFLPSPALLNIWLTRLKFTNIHLADLTKTTLAEQRTTDWMPFESLNDFLDPKDPSKTKEGHPAPTRAILTATKPT